MSTKATLRNQLKSVPRKPGVYIFKDASGGVLYVGKALSLRNRVASYFQKLPDTMGKTKTLVSRVRDFKVLVTDTEEEALILELNLIQKFRPPYNVNYRDDKSYPYVAITLDEEFPRVRVTREAHRPGIKYYGPFTKVKVVRETLKALRKVFPICTCSAAKFKQLKRQGSACLDYHIEKCPGPCIGAISPEEYRQHIEGTMLFLEGKADRVIRELKTEMKRAADGLEFEKAAELRARLEAARYIGERQKVVLSARDDYDFFGVHADADMAGVQVLQVRGGKLLGSESFILEVGAENTLESALGQYYLMSSSIPRNIVVPEDLESAPLITAWLGRRLSGQLGTKNLRKVTLKVAHRGEKKRLSALASKNARASLEMFRSRQEWDLNRRAEELTELKQALKLAVVPERIECFDISNTSGRQAVGSMVVFVEGRPHKDGYRRFKVRKTDGPDDFSMMKEVTERRLARSGEAQAADNGFEKMPDLMVVDGGKPQLAAVLSAMERQGVSVAVAALAKNGDRVYVPGRKEPLPPFPPKALALLQRVRDEAHRFAVDYHRGLRGKRMVSSSLDSLPGVGPHRKKMLLTRFGTPEKIHKASVKELEEVLPTRIAEEVHARLRS